jgi:alpha-L-rhamnosidase
LARRVTEQHDGHAFVGIHGARSLYSELDRHGHTAVAFRAMTQTNAPSYGYNLNVGLTTWPEVPAPQPPGRSLNHPMHSGFAAWFHESLAGIRPLAPGFKRIAIQPHGFAELAWVKAEHISPYGPIVSNWKRESDSVVMDVAIPVNTTAEVHIPAPAVSVVTESGKPVTQAKGVKFLRAENGTIVFAVASGRYQFGGRLK